MSSVQIFAPAGLTLMVTKDQASEKLDSFCYISIFKDRQQKTHADKLGLRIISDNAEDFLMKLKLFYYFHCKFWQKMFDYLTVCNNI